MRLGQVVALQADSPASKAGLEQDDFLVEIDDKPPGDMNTMALPQLFRAKAGETVALKVQRKGPAGQDAPVEIEVVPRNPPWYEEARVPEAPLSIPALGLALRVQNIIQSVEAGGPAENVSVMKGDQPASPDRLAPGEEIAKAELIGASREKQSEEATLGPMTIEFQDREGNAKSNWPFLISRIQNSLPDTKVRLTLRDGRTVEILPANSPTEFNPDRGFVFMPEEMIFRATSVGEAFELGLRETKKSLLQVYSFLRRIGTQVSAYALGGPGTIIQAAGGAASKGLPKLLLFLTMLSANLAVINFLPIPVLDGGHMVFLILEGIFRRPVDERIVAVC
jgi:regulator of sigma E protease